MRPRRPRLPRSRPRSTLRRCRGSRPGSGWDRVGPRRSRPRTHLPAPHLHEADAILLPRGNGAPSRDTSQRHQAWRRRRDDDNCSDGSCRQGSGVGHEHGSAPVARAPSTRRLATRWSPGGLSSVSRSGRLVLGRDSRLDAVSGSPVRTWLPSGAAVATTGPPAVRPARSSRTRARPPQPPIRPRRIETELSHDVLNPARVPLSWANSPTLGTFFSPRMR